VDQGQRRPGLARERRDLLHALDPKVRIVRFQKGQQEGEVPLEARMGGVVPEAGKDCVRHALPMGM
jgi:hypothetical protein